MYWAKFKNIGHISKNFGPSRKTLRPSWCPKLVTGLTISLGRGTDRHVGGEFSHLAAPTTELEPKILSFCWESLVDTKCGLLTTRKLSYPNLCPSSLLENFK